MKNSRKILSVVIFFLFCVSFVSFAQVPRLINYQGRLTDSSNKPLEGAYNLTFRIYDAEIAGNLLWEEVHPGVVVEKGIFSILLGSINVEDFGNLSFDKPYWLAIKVGDDPEMQPRQMIASGAYAIRSETAEIADNALNTQKIKGKDVSSPTAEDNDKFLQYDQTSEKFKLTEVDIPPTLSSLVFSFVGCSDAKSSTTGGQGYGYFFGYYRPVSGNLTPNTQEAGWHSNGEYRTVLQTKIKKTKGMSKIRVHTYLVGGSGIRISVNADGFSSFSLSGTSTGTATKQWVEGVMDVSSLTDNQVYDVAISLNGTMYHLIGLAE